MSELLQKHLKMRNRHSLVTFCSLHLLVIVVDVVWVLVVVPLMSSAGYLLAIPAGYWWWLGEYRWWAHIISGGWVWDITGGVGRVNHVYLKKMGSRQISSPAHSPATIGCDCWDVVGFGIEQQDAGSSIIWFNLGERLLVKKKICREC
jgi:hypothetical protein